MPAKMPKITQRGPALAEADIAAVEQRLGVSFPADYRAFLLQVNGGTPRPGKWVSQFFSVGDGEPSFETAFHNLKVVEQRIPRRLIAVAENAGGDLYCISTEGSDRGTVYFWTHERESRQKPAANGGPDDAALRKFAPSFEALLEKEAKVKRKNVPAWVEMIEDGDLAGFTRWLDAGARLSEYFEESGVLQTPLYVAVRERGIDFIDAILARGGTVDDAFHLAAGDPVLARRLLARGVSRAKLSELLPTGVFFHDLDLLRAVLDAGADPNHAERSARGHWTPLHRAALEGSADTIRVLLEHGAKPGVWREIADELPLHLAVRCRDFNAIKLLLDAGENLYAAPPAPTPSLTPHGPAVDVLRKARKSNFVQRVEAYAQSLGQHP
jgi:hypothetical protein